MAQLQRGRGRPVVFPPGEPLAQPYPVLVTHGGRRLITDPPAGCGQPPDEVDVLSDPHVFGETRAGGGLPHHQGRTGNVGDARSRPDDAGPRAHVERGACPLVPGQPGAPLLVRDDPRCDGAHRRIREVRQQQVQPAGLGHAIGVEERDQRRARRRQAGVPGRPRPAVHHPPQHARPGVARDARNRRRIGRAVIYHDHLRHLLQPGQAAGKFGAPVPHRDHHGHLARSRLTAGQRGVVQRRVGDSRVEQATRQRAGLGVVRHRDTRPPSRDMPGARGSKPQHPDGRTAGKHRPVR